MENDKIYGVVCWFDWKKGFGYITGDNQTKDHFIHFSNILMEGFKKLEAGQRVRYELGANHKGVQAINVELLGDNPGKMINPFDEREDY